jgi:uncharacterized protein YrrD
MQEHGKIYNTRDLLKAEVVDLQSGSVLGTVIEAILSTGKATVEFLGVLPAEWHKTGLLLRTDDIVGFDESVILISSAERLVNYAEKHIKKDFVSCSELNRLTLIDQKGQVYGNPVGVIFNQAGRIIALEAEKDLVMQMVTLEGIAAVGERYAVVEVSTEAELEAEPKQVAERREAPEAAVLEDATAELLDSAEDDSGNGEDTPPAGVYRERQIRYMLGKPSPVTLNGRTGMPVVTSGETISSAVINRLIEEGLLSQLFVALTVGREALSSSDDETGQG